MSAPYFDINTTVPTWGYPSGENTIVLRGRGDGLISGITPQTLIPHGETVSILTSGYVKNGLVSIRNGFEGIGHSLQGFVKGPTGSPVRVYNNNILTNGDVSQWINASSTDFRRITFIEQMPDNVNPEWLQSVWFVKGSGGTVYLRNLEFRDYYSRQYKNSFSAASWSGFTLQTHSNFLLERGASIHARSLQTIVMRISKGQAVTVSFRAAIDRVIAYDVVGVRTPFFKGFSLKMTRRSDGGIDWFSRIVANSTTEEPEIGEDSIGYDSTMESADAYTQVEILVWIMAKNRPSSEISSVVYEHSGVDLDIGVNENLTTGSE